MMPCSRGDVILVWFPDSNQQTMKRRPALVVQANNLGTGLSQVVLSMITSNLSRVGHPSRILLSRNRPEGAACGIVTDSVVMTDHLATLLEKAIDKVLGTMPSMTLIDVALRHTLGL